MPTTKGFCQTSFVSLKIAHLKARYGKITKEARKSSNCKAYDSSRKGEIMPNLEKKKMTIYVSEKTANSIERYYKDDGSTTRTDFIENAINYYIAEMFIRNTQFLDSRLQKAVRDGIKGFENRASSLMFKLAVEVAMIENIIATENEMDDYEITRLRGECVDEVKRLEGRFSFEDAVKWQRR